MLCTAQELPGGHLCNEFGHTDSECPYRIPQPAAVYVEVRLIGQIPAGVPFDAFQSAEETFRLPRRLVGHGKLFVLKVRGDSMTRAAITDGDLVVVRHQPVAENREIVAAQLDGTATAEATVKTLQQLDGHVWLLPGNPYTSRSPQMMPSSWARSSPSYALPSQIRLTPLLVLFFTVERRPIIGRVAADRMSPGAGRLPAWPG